MIININYKFEDIPYDIFETILQHFDYKTLFMFMLINKKFLKIANKNQIWKQIYLKTLTKKYKITNDSIHIHCQSQNPFLYMYEIKDNYKFQLTTNL